MPQLAADKRKNVDRDGVLWPAVLSRPSAAQWCCMVGPFVVSSSLAESTLRGAGLPLTSGRMRPLWRPLTEAIPAPVSASPLRAKARRPDPAYSRSSYLPRVNANKLRGGPYPEDNGLCVVSSREPSPSPDTSRPDLRIDETSSRLEARVCGETLMTTPLLPTRGTRATYLLPTTPPPAHPR